MQSANRSGRLQYHAEKINSVIPEVANQTAFAIIGRDMTIAMAAECSQLWLNAFEPILVSLRSDYALKHIAEKWEPVFRYQHA
ncbi:hypothetical protein [Brucella grignonensis]|uniref:Aspartate ammonia-lyase AspA domain protein n=1 Tax=Brucella grignonensis TaxID=94627 RepID=A0A256FNR9_9HYPH|nr:aspartate ammonia-lyase AspA domain protein [Brucella grignonensis]